MTHAKVWHEERQGGIGASEMAAIIGLSPWQTPWQVAQRKLEPVPDEEEPTSLRLWLGLRLEPVIAELAEVKLGVKLRRPSRRYWHPDAPMHCELDYKVQSRAEHVECKVANFGEDWGEDGSQTIPRHYIPQVQAQLAVTGNLRAHVACLYHGQELRVYTFERDEAYIADLIDYTTEWWERHIVRREPVPPLAADIETLRRRFPRDDESEMVATPEQADLVERFRLARLNVKQAEDIEGALKAGIIASMGEAAKLVGPDFTISYRTSKDSVRVDWESVAKAYRQALIDICPEEGLDAIESLYTATSPGSRRFVPTWKEKKG